MKTVGVADYINQTPLSIPDGKKSQFNTHKNKKKISNVHKIDGTHFQCVNNHYAKFKNCWSYRLHKPDTPYAFRIAKLSKINTFKKLESIIKCAHSQPCTSSI